MINQDLLDRRLIPYLNKLTIYHNVKYAYVEDETYVIIVGIKLSMLAKGISSFLKSNPDIVIEYYENKITRLGHKFEV